MTTWFSAGWIGLGLLGTLAACATPVEKARLETAAARADAHSRMPQRLDSLGGAAAECQPLRAAGPPGWSTAAECYNRRLIAAFNVAEPPYVQALFLNIAQRLKISDRVVQEMTTPAEAQALLATADRTFATNTRILVKAPELTPRQKEHVKEVATHADLVQQQADTEILLKAFERIQPPP